MIVTLKFSTKLAFSEERDFRQIMEAFFQGRISYQETAQRLGDNTEGLGLALGALFVLAQQKNPGFHLSVKKEIEVEKDDRQPQLTHERVAEIAQLHEAFLTELEGLAISAIASGDWSQVYDHINFYAPESES